MSFFSISYVIFLHNAHFKTLASKRYLSRIINVRSLAKPKRNAFLYTFIKHNRLADAKLRSPKLPKKKHFWKQALYSSSLNLILLTLPTHKTQTQRASAAAATFHQTKTKNHITFWCFVAMFRTCMLCLYKVLVYLLTSSRNIEKMDLGLGKRGRVIISQYSFSRTTSFITMIV